MTMPIDLAARRRLRASHAPIRLQSGSQDPSDATTALLTTESITAPAYAELHCLSDFSFQRGASSARELFGRAAELGYTALAITDECSLAGIVRAWEASKASGVRLIVGSEIQLADGPKLVLLVENQDGYTELCRLITLARRRSDKGQYHIERADLQNVAAGLCAVWCPAPFFSKNKNYCTANKATKLSGLCESTIDEMAAWVAETFTGRAWIAVELHRRGHDPRELAELEALGERHGLPRVAAGDVHMHVRGRRALQDVMTAIRLQTPLSAAGTALFPNGERHLRKREVLARNYGPTLLSETVRLAERCNFRLDTLRYEYPHELVPRGLRAIDHLEQLAWEGARDFWKDTPGGVPPKTSDLLKKEIVLIEKKEYAHFFLTVHDIVRWARDAEILCQGRGSAANSAVCFCLGITSVNPESGNLRIERFISENRHEPPDIDVDFEHERREEVLQYVFKKYGRERAALAATVITWQSKSAIRAVGAALGLGADQLDELSRVFGRGNSGESLGTLLAERGFDATSPLLARILELTGQLINMPRHLSQHVGGFVISEHPLHTLVPIENAAMADRTVIQWDKDDLESLKLLKVDCLALGMLTCLRKCLNLVQGYDPDAPKEIKYIEYDDKDTFEMIQKADTIGVFQIESRAQMSMLPRLKPKKFYDLVIEVAIVRPGPIQGGMVHPYLRRRSGEEPVEVPEDLKPALERTLGIPIFQEQVLHLLQLAASFTPDDADELRRSMAAWKRHGGLEHFHERILSGMAANGYAEEYAERIYQQILGFGSYGFPESHATSFAQLAYVSSWFKCHHPAAFACALLNSQPMGFYSPAQIVQDVRRHGVDVLPVDVSISNWDCTLEFPATRAGMASVRKTSAGALRIGLGQIKGLKQSSAENIIRQRDISPYLNVADLVRRADLDVKSRRCLSDANALQTLSGHRHQARWDSAGAERPLHLLDVPAMPEIAVTLRQPSIAENVSDDYASLGFSLEAHPVALARGQLRQKRLRDSRSINLAEHDTPTRTAGLVTVRQSPPTASGVTFITLEDEYGQINVLVWRDVAQRHRRALLESVLLGVDGMLQVQQGVRHLIAHRLHNLSALLPHLASQSRDFH
ncbi:MAG: error-prone DNA polymerase [Tahibacter sp.]